MNFNCTDIILAPDQTWSNHSSLLHIPKTFSEEIPCQCRFFPKYLEWVNLPIYLWSAMSTDELGSYWSPSKFCLPNCLGKKKQLQTNQPINSWILDTGSAKMFESIASLQNIKLASRKVMACNGHTLQLHDILRQSGKKITTGHWREIHPNFWKKNNAKPKQAGQNHVPVLSEKT